MAWLFEKPESRLHLYMHRPTGIWRMFCLFYRGWYTFTLIANYAGLKKMVNSMIVLDNLTY